MYDEKGYPWECERDGINTHEVCENPNPLATQRTHKEWHNSESGMPTEAPDYAQPAKPRRRG